MCISNKFPGDADATGLRTTLWKSLLESTSKLHSLSAYDDEGVLHILPYLTSYKMLSKNMIIPFINGVSGLRETEKLTWGDNGIRRKN